MCLSFFSNCKRRSLKSFFHVLMFTPHDSKQMDLGLTVIGDPLTLSAIEPCGYLAASGSNFRLPLCHREREKPMLWVTALRHSVRWLAVCTGTVVKPAIVISSLLNTKPRVGLRLGPCLFPTLVHLWDSSVWLGRDRQLRAYCQRSSDTRQMLDS